MPYPVSTTDLIRERLERLSPERVEVIDDSAAHAGHAGARSGGGHFQVIVVADAFAGHARLARHRMVYAAVADLMQKQIHALQIQAHTPDEL